MLDVFGTPSGTSCDVKQFFSTATWMKPRNASQVFIVLMGAGGGGRPASATAGGGGGGSGAVSTWFGAAMHVPDSLLVTVGRGGSAGVAGGATSISAYNRATSYTLLSANGGNSGAASATGGTGGAAFTANAFCAAGITNLTAGVAGGNANTNTYLDVNTPMSGGGGGATSATVPGQDVWNGLTPIVRGVPAGFFSGFVGDPGYFVATPLFLALGGAGGATDTVNGSLGGSGSIGSGGGGAGRGGSPSSPGGSGFAVIVSW